MINARSRIACLVAVLLTATGPVWALEPVGPASEAVLQILRGQEGEEPTEKDLVGTLNRATVGFLQAGEYVQAETVAREALALAERDLGPEHQVTLTTLNNLASSLDKQGRHGEAEPLYLRAIEAQERVLGQDHPDTLISVNNLAVLYYAQGRYDEAEPLHKQALEGRERVLGRDHPQTLDSLNNLAELYRAQGRYDEAEPLHKQALEGHERVLGRDHPRTLISVNNLALLYHIRGRYDGAESLYLRALEVQERVLGRDHPQTLISLSNLAELYRAQGRYDEAEPLLVRALEASERVLGRDHPQTLLSLNNLAVLYQAQGRYDEADPLHLRVLETSERTLGRDHPRTLSSLNNLARLYEDQGRYGEAEPLYLRVLKANERTLGQDHPQTLNSVNNLAGLYRAQGRYSEAEPLYLRALEIRKRTLGQNHPDTLASISNLAGLYHAQGRYDEAEPLLVRTLEANERVLGQDHPQTLTSVNNLAELYRMQGRSREAEPLYLRALEAKKQVLGKYHPNTLNSVNSLAFLYHAQGRYGEAEPLFVRALEAGERILGQDHPNTLKVQLNLALVLISSGQQGQAVRELRRMDGRLRGFVGEQLATTHRELVRRQWLLSESRFQNVVFNLALQHPGPDTLRLAADVLLRWKRLAGEAEALTARLVRTSRDPQVVKTAKALSKRRAELSRLVNLPMPDEKTTATARKNAIAAARAEMERLEVELAGLSQEFQGHLASRTVDWQQVRSELPRNSALLSLRAFSPVGFKTGDSGEPHWLALLIPADPGDGPELLLQHLGPIAPTTQVQRALRETILRETSSKEAARKLYQLLFGKLDAELTKYDRLYIAADGALDLVAFARLVVPDGRYWVERQELHRIQNGRDLLKSGSDSASAAKGMIAYGGVDYTNFPALDTTPSPPAATPPTTDGLITMTRRPCDERGNFGNLKFTGSEAKAVADFYSAPDGRKAEVWRGRDASETRIKARLKALASPPRVLHLATHGFFCKEKSERTERPMTLAGLALAGANAGFQGKLSPTGEDGILYALEVQDLNLEDTELVTLSACDTGKGEVDYSEGVYGLVRAFRIAGARNLLMTLWSLDDPVAAVFMRDFYINWLQDHKPHPAEALRKTQLDWIRAKDSKRSNPSYWAPYVLIEGR
ncbi:MAG: tetratricopeptide repeat protein [Candidatus Thiosymbion ectosymbiont of Robbea hypermnestra]|nr:tetratricopeptide repeat protein [Candidatus Thiosymbion ectosymbiont of Robbea hypermnestra]